MFEGEIRSVPGEAFRAAATFSLPKQQAAAVTVATLPGAKLFHQGQFEGHRVKLPVFLRRGPAESAVPALQAFYRQLLTVIKRVAFREGTWTLCGRKGEDRHLIVVNLSDFRSQGHVLLPWDDISGRSWRLTDAFTSEVYERDGNGLRSPGLYVDLQPWGFHVLSF